MVRFGVLAAVLLIVGAAAPARAASGAQHSRPAPTTIAELLEASVPQTTKAVAGPRTSVPYGWMDFCRRYAGECDATPEPAAEIELTPASFREIDRINRLVNGSIEPVSDAEHWGVLDRWDYPTDGKGDCEDYALLKRKLLLAAGFPRQALLMTVVRGADGEGHAVLTVVSDHGDFVLDNLSDQVEPWNANGYRYVKRQSQEDPNLWLSLRGTDVPAVAATR